VRASRILMTVLAPLLATPPTHMRPRRGSLVVRRVSIVIAAGLCLALLSAGSALAQTTVRAIARISDRVSVSSSGAQGNGESGWPSLSADGRYVAFTSEASNLVAGDTNGAADVFVHDRQTGATNSGERVELQVSRNGRLRSARVHQRDAGTWPSHLKRPPRRRF